MNKIIIKLLVLSLVLSVTPLRNLFSQSVMDPNDPIVVYNSANPPAEPAWGQIGKWVKTNRLSWNTSSYKCYVYKSNQFRLKFPKTYNPTANDGKKYPIIIFFHGAGEKGSIYDNEFQLYHGGQNFSNMVDNGTFDGYVLAMQTTSGFWGDPQFDAIKEILDYMIANNKVDPYRIIDNGLSSGGAGTWDMTIKYPTYIAGMLPMSMSSTDYQKSAVVNSLKYTPIWIFQGGLDGAPDPYTTQQVRDAFLAAGGNFKYTEYPDLGHGTWDRAWAEPDFFPFALRAYKSNPWTLFGRTEFCPGDAINVTLGLTAGLQAYQWRKDGVVISGATSNTLQVTQLGTYDARVQRNGIWSDWSPTPVQIKIKAPTVPPPITIPNLMSNVIPALDGNNGVTLQVPAGYATYQWQKVGNSTVLGTSNTYYATAGGDYTVKVNEQFGCSSDFSTPVTVIDANGPNKPDPASNLGVTTLSKTSLRLDWTDNPAPQYNETKFEVYQATSASGPYKLIAFVNANVLTYTVTGLNSNTTYWYEVRAVNNTGAAVASNVASGSTAADTQKPTSPSNLSVTGSTRSSVSLSWTASSDDVGVTGYDIYVDGQKMYVNIKQTNYTVNNLQFGKSYNFAIRAKDFAGNQSPFSNQVTAQPLLTGLNYKYYTFTGTWNALPNFATLVPAATGISANVDITLRTQEDNFAFLWEGFIHIPSNGTYYFRTNSDDGSRVWLGSLNGTTSPYNFSNAGIVNNDGLHGGQNKTSTGQVLTAGVYPIAIAYYEQSGGQSMTLSWSTNNISFTTIPNSAFADQPVVNGTAPADPSGLTATAVSYKKINLAWTDNSSANETGFEIWRSTNPVNGYTTIGMAAANSTTYSDTTVAPNTTYYYKIRAIGQYGQSNLIPRNDAQANWRFNNNLADSSANGRTLSGNNAPTFNTDRKEGSHAVDLNGTNQSITVNTASGDYLRGGYSVKTVAFWLRADNTSANRGVFDFGGSDNGLGMYINANTLFAGIASSNTRRSVSVAYSSSAWNHIALVYSTNTLRLYVNGTLVASNTSLGFNSVGTTTNASMIGDDNGTTAFNTAFGAFDGRIDNFWVFDKALSASDITLLMNDGYDRVSATTQALPAVPPVPANLVATGVSNSKITVNWNDVANETGFELFRSSNNNGNYILYRTLPANTTSFDDNGLFANSIFYYKVRSVNVGGSSNFSNEDSAKAINNPPSITNIPTQYMRYGTVLNLNVSASDQDPETITLQVTNLPSFATYTPNGNGTGVISFNSTSSSDQGTYNGITVTATDQNGGTSQVTFNLIVNNNFNPDLGSVSNITLNEKQSSTINLTATDPNAGDVLTWSYTGLPSFATTTATPGQLNLNPGYSDAGTYLVKVKVDDGNNGTDTASFVVTVNDVNPNKKYYVNFTNGLTVASSPWNNTSAYPAINKDWPNLKDETGVSGSIGIKITSDWANMGYGDGTNDYGQITGNNSGVYPDNVMKTAYFTNDNPQSFSIYGLDPTQKYSFTFFGSRGGVNDDRTSIYTIGGTSVSLQTANNTQNTVKVSNLTPNANGTLTLTLSKPASSPFAYINAMVIESIYDDGSAPAKPRNIAAQFANNQIAVSWLANAFNATGYEVFRATNLTGPYTSLNPGANDPNQQLLNDANIVQNSTYYYYVKAKNAVGYSPSSDTVSVSIPNVAPVLATINNVSINAGQTQNLNVTATDAASDIITLSVSGLPSFATFQNNGNGTGVIGIAPTSVHVGTYPGITVTATDNFGGVSTKTFSITVNYANTKNVYLNFNDGSTNQPAQGAPWNNMNAVPNAGTTVSNLKDESGNNTGFGISLVEAWDGANNLGPVTGNNSGVYPDNVMKSFYYDGSGTDKHINLTGFSTKYKYNITFYGGRSGVSDNRTTVYTIGSQSVQLNAASNVTQTVQITGVTPDANGRISITVNKDPGSFYSYLNAMVIQYPFDTTFYAPSDVRAAGIAKDKIKVDWINNYAGATSFEIWRSTSANGSYSLLATVPSTQTTYTNTGLAAGTSFFYKIRAIAGSRVSDYSNIAGASTVAYTVDLNFNDGSSNPAQPGNWNNTNVIFSPGFVLPNMINQLGQNTGINFEYDGEFTGYNIYGQVTGNNTGVYPDNVMAGFFYVNFGDTARWRFTGLNLTSTYNFKFFGSRQSPTGGPVVTSYKIGSDIVVLDATDNTQNTVQINGVKPDSTGTVYVTLYTTAGRGYINAMTIEGAPSATETITPPFDNSKLVKDKDTKTKDATPQNQVMSNLNNAQETVTETKVSIYPNPFAGDINLVLDLAKNIDKANVSVLDASGKMVFMKELKNLKQGYNQQGLGLNGSNLKAGTYFVQLQLDGEKPRIFKVIKL